MLEVTAFWKDKPELAVIKPVWEECNKEALCKTEVLEFLKDGEEVIIEYVMDEWVSPAVKWIVSSISGGLVENFKPYRLRAKYKMGTFGNDWLVYFEMLDYGGDHNVIGFSIVNYGQSWRVKRINT
jgi:hypothetical protein